MAKKQHKKDITNPQHGLPMLDAIKLIFAGGTMPNKANKKKTKKNPPPKI